VSSYVPARLCRVAGPGNGRVSPGILWQGAEVLVMFLYRRLSWSRVCPGVLSVRLIRGMIVANRPLGPRIAL